MTTDNETDTTKIITPRQPRYHSHALVEVRRFKQLPVFCYSAVLLDLSLGGFKIEFTSELQADRGQRYWLNIPLSPLGIYAPKRILCHCECRWFDSNRFRMGGVFLELSKQDKLILEQVITTLQDKNS